MPPTRVVVVQAVQSPVRESLSLVGSVAANEFVEIRSEIDGVVESVAFEEGHSVEAGHLLIELDRSKLEAELAETQANLEETRSLYERNRELLKDRLVSESEFDVIASRFRATEASVALRTRRLEDTRIQAPFAGVVSAREVSPGQVISRNTTLTWLLDLDPVKVEFDVPERFLSELSVGQTIEVFVATFPNHAFYGDVYFVAPFVDPSTRTALVKAQVPNPDRLLKPGMFANLDLTLTVRENAWVMPETAIYQLLEQDQAQIYLVADDNTAELRVVTLGVRMPRVVEVREGLSQGDRVIVEGIQKIAPGMPVDVGETRRLDGIGAADGANESHGAHEAEEAATPGDNTAPVP